MAHYALWRDYMWPAQCCGGIVYGPLCAVEGLYVASSVLWRDCIWPILRCGGIVCDPFCDVEGLYMARSEL